jgi:hypothetical protein
MQEAFARDATPPPTPASPSETAATGPDAPPTPESATPPAPQGPIPFEAHKKILSNAYAERDALKQELDSVSWAKSIPQQQLQQWADISTLMASNPAGFLERYFAEAVNDPRFASQVKSWAARTLSSRAAAQPDLTPNVEIVNEHGQVVGKTYSEDRLKALLEYEVSQRLQPLVAESEQRKAERVAQETQQRQLAEHQRLSAQVDDALADTFAVLEIAEDTPVAQKDALLGQVNALMQADPKLTVHKAAMQVRKTAIVPTLEEKARTKVLGDLKTKAGAQAVNPSGAIASTTHRPKSFNDPSLRWD